MAARFKRYTDNGRVFHLTPLEWSVYRYLEKNCDRWVTKQELMFEFPELRTGGTNHDECAKLNSIRINLLEALKRDMISHIVMVKDNAFKVATRDSSEYLDSADREMRLALKHLTRYWTITKAIQSDGQGRLVDKRGNVITEESLAKRFNEALMDN